MFGFIDAVRKLPQSCQPRVVTIALTAFAVIIAIAAPASAQTTVYPVKFVCGFVDGNIRILDDSELTPDSQGYEDLKPGNYATLVNIFHSGLNNERVQVWAKARGQRAVSLNSLDAIPFATLDVGCVDIATALGFSLGPELEGWLLLFTTSDEYSVSPVYTYASQNGFVDHRYHQVRANGMQQFFGGEPVFNPFDGYIPSGIGMAPVSLPETGIQGAVVATGAGGLGLGASIDVETVDAVTLSVELTSSQISEYMERLP